MELERRYSFNKFQGSKTGPDFYSPVSVTLESDQLKDCRETWKRLSRNKISYHLECSLRFTATKHELHWLLNRNNTEPWGKEEPSLNTKLQWDGAVMVGLDYVWTKLDFSENHKSTQTIRNFPSQVSLSSFLQPCGFPSVSRSDTNKLLDILLGDKYISQKLKTEPIPAH